MVKTRPGIRVDIHPSRHVRESLGILRAHPFTLLEIAAFGVIPTAGNYLVTSTWTGIVVFQIPFIIAQQVVYGALVLAVASFADATLSTAADVLQAYRIALGKLRDLVEVFARQIGAAFLLTITVVGIPWAIRLFVRWSFGIYAVVLNDLSAKDAISFSCDLVTGRWWQVTGLLLATFAPGGIISLLILLLTQSTLVSLLFSVMYALVATPFYATFWTLQFLELRASHPDYQAETMCAT